MRKPHKLSRSSGSKRPQMVIFFDTETEQIKSENGETQHVLKLGHAIRTRTSAVKYLYENDNYRIDSIGGWWDKLEQWVRSKTTTYLVAHNLVFDLVVMDGINQLANRGWKLQSFYSKGMVSIFRWSKGDKKLVGMDNGNLFTGALAKWGKVVGLPKLDVEFQTVTDEELYTYCIRDVEIMVRLWRRWLQFLSDNDCGNFMMTTASTAFNAYRHRFMNEEIFIHADEQALELERHAYKGGRVEVLFQGTRKKNSFYYLDINSQYPHVLKENKYPYALVDTSDEVSLSFLKRKLETYAVIANVDIFTQESIFSHRVNGKTCYPVGRFTTTLTTNELLYAIDKRMIFKVNKMSWYKQEYLFSEFIDFFYKYRLRYRKAGNEDFATICKLMMNSLYGKWGQRGFDLIHEGQTDNKNISRETIYDFDTGKKFDRVYMAGQVFREERTGEAYNSFPAIAAHTTANARLLLYSIMSLVPKGHLFYTDTDCVIVDKTGYKAVQHLIDDNKLGAIKIEVQSSWLTINAPKDYRMRTRDKIKGIKKNARKINRNTYEQEQFIRLGGLIRSGDVSRYTTKKITKTLKRIIYSGIVSPSGFVDPFELTEWPFVFPVILGPFSVRLPANVFVCPAHQVMGSSLYQP